MKKKALILTLAVFFLLYIGVASSLETKESLNQNTISFISITVEPGDTMWSITEEYRGQIEHQTFLRMIQQFNNMEHTVVREGATLKIPVF